LFELIDSVLETWDCEYLEELSIELNPDPFDEVIAFVVRAQKKYTHLFRIRFSFGIQSLDDTVLSTSGRQYVFNNLIHFFRELVEVKTANAVYNLDFIAFGSTPTKQGADVPDIGKWLPWDQLRRDFFEKVVKSQMFDGVSVYTLELFPGAERYYKTKEKTQPGAILSDDETIWKEFQYIKNTVMDAGYGRYEISNFALA
jgi:coproporphyrinogen III oxidase-like Fe-S oxidoreductase